MTNERQLDGGECLYEPNVANRLLEKLIPLLVIPHTVFHFWKTGENETYCTVVEYGSYADLVLEKLFASTTSAYGIFDMTLYGERRDEKYHFTPYN